METDGSVSYSELSRLVDFHVDQGTDAIVVAFVLEREWLTNSFAVLYMSRILVQIVAFSWACRLVQSVPADDMSRRLLGTRASNSFIVRHGQILGHYLFSKHVVGEGVRLEGLHASSRFNGSVAIVHSVEDARGRLNVQLLDCNAADNSDEFAAPSLLSVKTRHLISLFAPEQLVILHSLDNESMNGMHGVVEKMMPRGRVQVKIQRHSGPDSSVSIKMENLKHQE